MTSALFLLKDPSDFFLDCPLGFTSLPIWLLRHTLPRSSPVTSVRMLFVMDIMRNG